LREKKGGTFQTKRTSDSLWDTDSKSEKKLGGDEKGQSSRSQKGRVGKRGKKGGLGLKGLVGGGIKRKKGGIKCPPEEKRKKEFKG